MTKKVFARNVPASNLKLDEEKRMKLSLDEHIKRLKERKLRAEIKSAYYLMIANDLDEKISRLLRKKKEIKVEG